MCPACYSTIALLLGNLGKLTWFRCRDCGMDYHESTLETEMDETE